MELQIPKYNTYRLVAAKPQIMRQMLMDFFTQEFKEREADLELRPKPIDVNRYAHSLGFPSYQRLVAFAKSEDCPGEVKDLLEYGRSLIESDHLEGGLMERYNATISKLVLSSMHNMNEKIENLAPPDQIVFQILGVQPVDEKFAKANATTQTTTITADGSSVINIAGPTVRGSSPEDPSSTDDEPDIEDLL